MVSIESVEQPTQKPCKALQPSIKPGYSDSRKEQWKGFLHSLGFNVERYEEAKMPTVKKERKKKTKTEKTKNNNNKKKEEKEKSAFDDCACLCQQKNA